MRAIRSIYQDTIYLLLDKSHLKKYETVKKSIALLITATVCLSYTSCITKRTQRKGNAIVDEKYVIKRPVKKFLVTVAVE